jgi:hypothetical protein
MEEVGASTQPRLGEHYRTYLGLVLVFWEKKVYKPPTFEELNPRTPSGTSEL